MMKKTFIKQVGVQYPIICGAMYPCSNPELIAAVSNAGGIGVVQPLSMTYVYGYELRQGLKYLKSLTSKPFGMNILVEQSSATYEKSMREVVNIALEEGCRFFITALGNPQWVVHKVKQKGGVVYHDATEKKWAEKAISHGVDGIICVNNRAGGHAGIYSREELYYQMKDLGVPLICAGGIGDEVDFISALEIGYQGVQMGTRFIASTECAAKKSYKEAIVKAHAEDIILTERVTGIPLSVINTPHVQKIGTKAGPIARYLLRLRVTKKMMRLWYAWNALRDFKKMSLERSSTKDYWQAGKSVSGIYSIENVEAIIKRFIKVKKFEF